MIDDMPVSFPIGKQPKGEITTAHEVESRLLRRVFDSVASYDQAISSIVQFYAGIGRFDEALTWLNERMLLVKNAEQQASLNLSLGRLREGKRDFQGAVEAYLKVISLQPMSRTTRYFGHNNLGYSLNQLGSFSEAEDYCRKAIQIDPDRHNAYKNLGLSLEGQQRYQEAAQQLMMASQRNAADPRAMNHLMALIDRYPEILTTVPGLKAAIKSYEPMGKLAEKLKKSQSDAVGKPPQKMVNAMGILQAVHDLVYVEGVQYFSRKDIRDKMGINQEEWMSGYTAIFQAMREDQPGGAPPIRKEYKGIFKRVRRGVYCLTEYGHNYIKRRGWQIVLMG